MSATHLSKIQFHFLPQKFCFMKSESGICGREGTAEVDPDSFEAFKILEGDVLVIGPEEGFKLGLEKETSTRQRKG